MTRRVPRQRCFTAYGVRVGLRADDPALLAPLDASDGVTFPPGWRTTPAASEDDVAWFDASATDRGGTPHRRYRLEREGKRLAAGLDVHRVAQAFLAHAELVVAEHAPDHLFVHAGVVAWRDRAVLLPGRSGAGKTSLVRACLEAGAVYYSDEYAVLDRDGRVHPYPRALAIRGHRGEPPRHVPATALGASVGQDPLPVALVVVTEHRPGARWKPQRLSAARTLLALMSHTVAARGSPAHSMPILKRAAARARTFAGDRGEAAATVPEIVARLDLQPAETHSAPAGARSSDD